MKPDAAETPERTHIVGIAGSGMSGLAEYLVSMNAYVTGSDLRISTETRLLADLGVTIFNEHSASNIRDADVLVTSDAIPAGNPEVAEARNRGLRLMRRAEFLTHLAREKQKVYVAGSHGKTTTTAMIAHILEAARKAPSFIIGANVPCLGNRRAHSGKGELFIAEACEAFQNLSVFRPDVAVITNIEDEHLEHYRSQAELDAAFLHFAQHARHVIANGDDPGVRRALSGFVGRITTYGFRADNSLSATSRRIDWEGSSFSVRGEGIEGTIRVPVPGAHIVSNALACIAACRSLGLSFEQIARGLSCFTGASRRWEDHGLVNGVRVIDDYAHHPTELRVNIATARTLLGDKDRLTIAFQPQLFSRTLRLKDELADVLAECDQVLLLEIDPGGEKNPGTVGSRLLADKIKKKGVAVELFSGAEDFLSRARHLLKPGILLIAGAGSVQNVAQRLCQELQSLGTGPITQQSYAPKATKSSTPLVANLIRAALTSLTQPTSLLGRFMQHVRDQPDARAASDSFSALTYRDLNLIADELAQNLSKRGVVSGTVVAVALPSSIDLVATAVALLKLGAIYLPLDDALPADRAQYMLERAKAELFLTLPGSLLDEISLGGETKKIYRHELRAANVRHVSRFDRIDVGHGRKADPGVYICFTSGSTGYPKGVLIRERSLSTLVSDIVSRFGVSRHSKTVLNTSISFDVSLAEIWMTLCGGGELLVTGSTKPLVGEKLAKFIKERAVTHLLVTPSVLSSVEPQELPSLSCIVCAGEACPQELVDQWAGGRRLFNAYGPTEATIYATAALCQKGEKVTIGRALKHARTYILDEELKRVGLEEVGELCLGGPCVAAGYLGVQPGTDGKFLYWETRGKKAQWIYRTGDLVRRERHGIVSFVGRSDQQVKIRGNRIELEEIEQSIKRLPGVTDAAVCITEHHPRELVAFFVAKTGELVDQVKARETLARWLPSYMLPAHLSPVAEIPLTTTGKKNRRALLQSYREAVAPVNFFEAPRNDVERQLASIWKEVLELQTPMCVYDDFTSLGGDSLRSLLVIGAIEERFNLSVPPGFFGRFSTITRMAVQVTELLWEEANGKQVNAGSGFRSTRIYKQLRDLTSAWDGTRASEESLIVSTGNPKANCDFFISIQTNEELQLLNEYLGEDVRLHGMRSGHLVMDYTPGNVDALASHYLEEIQAISPSGRILVGGPCQGGIIAHAVASKLLLSGTPIGRLVMIEQGRLLPYLGEITFVFTENSFQHPTKRRNGGGIVDYHNFYSGRCTVEFIPGEHATLWVAPTVSVLAEKLKALAAK